MSLDGLTLHGFADCPYERWLARHLRRVLQLETKGAVALSWGVPPPKTAHAVVRVPREARFADRPEGLRAQPMANPADGLTVRPGGPPTVELGVDLIAWIGWLVSRAEEYDEPRRDTHGRFPPSAALLEQSGMGTLPVADVLAARLRAALCAAAKAADLEVRRQSPWPQGKRFAVCLTHDVDRATGRSFWQAVLRGALAGATAVLGRTSLSRGLLDQAAGFLRGGGHSPFWLFDRILEMEAAAGVRSSFNVLPLDRSVVREGRWLRHRYRCNRPRLASLCHRLVRDGWEVGVHYPYATVDDPEAMVSACRRLEGALGPEVTLRGGRAHYLQFRVPETWHHIVRCGLRYDATVGWADRPGFRSGTCWPHQPFDRRRNDPIDLWELGVHLLDTHVPRGRALATMVEGLLSSVARVGGCACLLFHPSPPVGMTVRAFLDEYREVLSVVTSQREAWVATPAEVVRQISAEAS